MLEPRWFVLTLAWGLSACATSDRLGYTVVRATAAFDASGLRSSDNLYPWYRGPTAPGEIVVSNACGFVTFKYEAAALADYLSNSVAVHWSLAGYRVLSGEWCQISPFVFDHDTLVRYRIWNGTRYLLASAPVLTDDAGSAFVEDAAFISDYELEHGGPQRLQDPGCCIKRLFLRDLKDAR